MVRAWLWLWLVTVLVVTDSCSLAVARRMPVRAAVRRAEAWFSADECGASAAAWFIPACPCSQLSELPLDCEAPPPPNSGIEKPPLADSVWNELPPLEASAKAELKVASVEVS